MMAEKEIGGHTWLSALGILGRFRCSFLEWLAAAVASPTAALVRSVRESWSAQRLEAGNGVTEGCAQEDIGREMRLRAYAGQADGSSKAIREPGHPTMMVIARGEYGGYGKG